MHSLERDARGRAMRKVIAPTTRTNGLRRSLPRASAARGNGHRIGARPAPNAVEGPGVLEADVDLWEIADRAIALAETLRRSSSGAGHCGPGAKS